MIVVTQPCPGRSSAATSGEDRLARYEKLKAREREVLGEMAGLSDEVVAEIEAAEYGVEPG